MGFLVVGLVFFLAVRILKKAQVVVYVNVRSVTTWFWGGRVKIAGLNLQRPQLGKVIFIPGPSKFPKGLVIAPNFWGEFPFL